MISKGLKMLDRAGSLRARAQISVFLSRGIYASTRA